MSAVIHKFQMTPGCTSLAIPLNSLLLDAQNQNGCLVVWAAVDPKEEGLCKARVVMTGEALDNPLLKGLSYFRTVQCGLVLHLYMDDRLRRAS